MIKKVIITSLIALSTIVRAIAQPIDYLSQISLDPPAPQNYLYGEMPETQAIKPLYDLTNHKKRDIIDIKEDRLNNNLWFAPGYCTSYVAWKRTDLFGGSGNNKFSWDAKDWLSKAKAAGISTGKEPKQWAIAVFAPWKWALSLWHVAYVEYVWDNGLIVITDMNFKHKYTITTRVISEDLAAGYIY